MKKIPTYIITFIVIAFGLLYLFAAKPMPYHVRFMAVPLSDIPANVLTLFMYMVRILGSYFICVGVIGVILVHHHEKGRAWIRWTMLLMYAILLIPLLIFTLKVGWYSPWWAVVFLMIMAGINFFVLYLDERR